MLINGKYWAECPICGKEDKLYLMDCGFFNELVNENDRAMLAVECKRCDLMMQDFTLDENDYGKRCEILRAKWNTRTVVLRGDAEFVGEDDD